MNNINNEQEIRTNEYLKEAIKGVKDDLIEMTNSIDQLDLYTNMVSYQYLWHMTVEHGHYFVCCHVSETQVSRIETAYKHILLSKHHNGFREDNLSHNGYPENSWYISAYENLYKSRKIADENMCVKIEVANFYFEHIDSRYPDKSIPLELEDYKSLHKIAEYLVGEEE